MKFWVDENIDSYIINKLKQYGHEICIAKRGTDDSSILLYAIEENAVIINMIKILSDLFSKKGNYVRESSGYVLISSAD